jgi:hypothetical protein
MNALTPSQIFLLLAPTFLSLGGFIAILVVMVMRRADTEEARRLHERVRMLEVDHAADMAQIVAFREEIFYLGRLISILAQQIEGAGMNVPAEILAYLQRRHHTPPPIVPDSEIVALVRHALNHYFNIEELRALAFDVGVEWDNLPGSRKEDKARELVLFLDRRGQMELLIRTIRENRPNAPLPFGGRDPPQ